VGDGVGGRCAASQLHRHLKVPGCLGSWAFRGRSTDRQSVKTWPIRTAGRAPAAQEVRPVDQTKIDVEMPRKRGKKRLSECHSGMYRFPGSLFSRTAPTRAGTLNCVRQLLYFRVGVTGHQSTFFRVSVLESKLFSNLAFVQAINQPRNPLCHFLEVGF
jgi:hypothetical protein